MGNIKIDFYRPQDFYQRRVFFIVLISMVFVTVVSSRHMTDQFVILKNFMKRQNQRDEVSKYLIPCTAIFIEEYFEYPDRISFLLPDTSQDISVVIEPLMKELRITNAIYTLNVSLMNVMETYDALTNVVILSKSGITLETNDSSFVYYCEYGCNFIIVLTNLFTDEESFLIEAGTLVQQMSLQSIFKLEILASVGDSVLLASSLPVRINESYALAEPAFSGRCEQQATAIRWQHFANKTKPLLDASTVNAATFNNFPFAFFTNNTNYFDGVEGSMVEEIARSMGIKLNRETIQLMQETLKIEIYQRLYNATNDLIFGGLLWDFSRKVEYTTCYGVVHISWIIPFQINVSLRGLIAPFDASVWYAIICALIAGGLIKLFFIRDITFLDIAAIVLGVPVFRQPMKISSRIQFISWTLFGFFLTQLYLGSLAEYLMRTSDIQMDSIEELANSELKLGGTRRFADLLQTSDKEDNVERIIRERFFIFEQTNYSNQFLDLVEGRNTSFALLVMLNLTQNPSKIGYAHVIKEAVGSYPLAIVTRRDFPYLREFNFKIQMLVQTGLVEFWSNMAKLKERHYITENEGDDSILELDDISPAFFLLIIGYLGGFCLLIIEVIFYEFKFL